MAENYWHKQTNQSPLFPDLLWSRPQNKRTAGKLLIIGGNAQGLAAPAQAYNEASAAGIGAARVVLPDSLQKTVRQLFTEVELAPSSPSGSFAKSALGILLEESSWADAVLLAGDFGRNSETAILLENFVGKYSGNLILSLDAVDYFIKSPAALVHRTKTLLVINMTQLQKLAQAARFPKPFVSSMDIVRLVDALHEFTQYSALMIVIKHLEQIFVAVDGQVSTTKLEKDEDVWRIPTATRAAVWWLQNPSKPFESISISAVFSIPFAG